MSIRKPLEKKVDLNHKEIERIIDRGAKVKSDKEEKKWTFISLRLPLEMIENIDEKVEERPGMTRTSWILEAIKEKLNK